MRNGIQEFRPRQPLDRQLGANTLNQILRELESLRITRVVNGTFRKLPGGTEITVATQRGGSSTPITRQPWDLIAQVDPESDQENPSYLINVRPGTVAGLLPTNWDEQFSCDSETLYYAKALITTDGRDVTQAEIAVDQTPPSEQESVQFGVQAEVEILFGLFFNTAYRTIANGHIQAQPEAYITTTASPAALPGEIPYTIWYKINH